MLAAYSIFEKIMSVINGFKPNVPSWGVLWAVMDVDILDIVGAHNNQTSVYCEKLLDGGLTEGLPMKLEVAGIPPGLLRCGIWRNTWAGVVRIRS